jgi:hypothetical protein
VFILGIYERPPDLSGNPSSTREICARYANLVVALVFRTKTEFALENVTYLVCAVERKCQLVHA